MCLCVTVGFIVETFDVEFNTQREMQNAVATTSASTREMTSSIRRYYVIFWFIIRMDNFSFSLSPNNKKYLSKILSKFVKHEYIDPKTNHNIRLFHSKQSKSHMNRLIKVACILRKRNITSQYKRAIYNLGNTNISTLE